VGPSIGEQLHRGAIETSADALAALAAIPVVTAVTALTPAERLSSAS
jgi:hypothetical protein